MFNLSCKIEIARFSSMSFPVFSLMCFIIFTISIKLAAPVVWIASLIISLSVRFELIKFVEFELIKLLILPFVLMLLELFLV